MRKGNSFMGEVTDMFGDRRQTQQQRHAQGMERVSAFFVAVLEHPANPEDLEEMLELRGAVRQMRDFAFEHGMSGEDIEAAYEVAKERFIAQYSQVS
jgi:hypothetical protein